MKQYGVLKATEFTAKQINVIFAKAKKGELRVERFYMSHLYRLADYYDYDSNGSVEWEERFIKLIIGDVFNNRLEEAQEKIDKETEDYYNALSLKNQKKADRSYI